MGNELFKFLGLLCVEEDGIEVGYCVVVVLVFVLCGCAAAAVVGQGLG